MKLEGTVTKLEKIPAFGKDFDGIRIHANVEDLGYVSIPIPLGLVPPKVGATLRVEATWAPFDGGIMEGDIPRTGEAYSGGFGPDPEPIVDNEDETKGNE